MRIGIEGRLKDRTEHVIQTLAPLPAIRLGKPETSVRLARAGVMLVAFMRIVALLWLAEGVAQWADLLTDKTGEAFAALSLQRTAAVFFFCVLVFVAAVGLWLATPWGGVVWLVTVGAQILSLLLLPGFWGHATLLVVVDSVLVPVYLSLAWYAGQGDQNASI